MDELDELCQSRDHPRARSLTDSFSGISPIDAPVFIAAQFVGALSAGVMARVLFDPVDAKATPH